MKLKESVEILTIYPLATFRDPESFRYFYELHALDPSVHKIQDESLRRVGFGRSVPDCPAI